MLPACACSRKLPGNARPTRPATSHLVTIQLRLSPPGPPGDGGGPGLTLIFRPVGSASLSTNGKGSPPTCLPLSLRRETKFCSEASTSLCARLKSKGLARGNLPPRPKPWILRGLAAAGVADALM